MSEKKAKSIFIEGPISAGFIGDSIAKHQSKTDIGAHAIFLGQVRADEKEGRSVTHIDYTAYEEMALQKVHAIRESAFAAYPLSCMHIYHSLGTVRSGEISLFVFVSAAHRDAAFTALREIVEKIKADVPIWGKEMFGESDGTWKVNQ
ncbi:MAG: molybdenum cofactor biosynthesis protein MoaE [Saprospiraceae bacterium]|nr:molybdenum cofactor biosynthesis protein MoaE [Saprospiraceae bacterium]